MELPAHHPFRSQKAKEEYLAYYDQRAKKWPVVSQSGAVETPYGQTFVHTSGPVQAPPLVLLPGLAFNALMWMPNVQALSADYRTYVVDPLYDYGRSTPTRPLKSRQDLVNWLDGLFDALGLGNNVNLMGISFGGWLASQYALRAQRALHLPKRLAKIVLLAPAATVLPMRLEFLFRALGFGSRSDLIRWTFADLACRDESGRKMLEELIDDVELAARCFKKPRRIFPSVLTDKELKDLTVPTLYLVGENEKIYAARKAVQRLNRVAPQIETEIIPGAGHDLTFVQPEMVAARIIGFLKQP